MNNPSLRKVIHPLDDKREVALAGDHDQTLEFSVDYFFEVANQAIEEKGFCTVALSGGSTPKALFKKWVQPQNITRVDWKKIHFFFGDERSVPPDHNDSNYKMAMDNALAFLKIPQDHIYRMHAENEGEKHANEYALKIQQKVPEARFDLIMLGMGDDGHTASLFPGTKALDVEDKWVVYNEVPQKHTHRMTFTFPLINRAHHICFFVLGASKKERVHHVLGEREKKLLYPCQRVGTKETKALWILDEEAAKGLHLP